MKKIIILAAAAIMTAAGTTGCAICESAIDTVKNYDWSAWWSTHKDTITELGKTTVENSKTTETEKETAK